MRKNWQANVYPLIVSGFGGACVYGGHLGELTMRDWRSLLVLAGMLAGFFGLLWLGPQDRSGAERATGRPRE